jgi:hypothetical protein
MAWIKVEHTTPLKPEVLRIARTLGITRDDAFGKVIRFWMWLDAITVDGDVDGLTSQDVDAVVGVSGFANALQSVSWLEIDEQNQMLRVPNFTDHNGESAKLRAGKSKRQNKWRQNKPQKSTPSNVDAATSTGPSTREDKRREEKREEIKEGADQPPGEQKATETTSEKPPEKKPKQPPFDAATMALPAVLNTPAFRSTWEDWISYRRGDRLSVKQPWAERLLAKLATYGEAIATTAIQQAIDNNWQGCFPEKLAANGQKPHNGMRGPAVSGLKTLKEKILKQQEEANGTVTVQPVDRARIAGTAGTAGAGLQPELHRGAGQDFPDGAVRSDAG